MLIYQILLLNFFFIFLEGLNKYSCGGHVAVKEIRQAQRSSNSLRNILPRKRLEMENPVFELCCALNTICMEAHKYENVE